MHCNPFSLEDVPWLHFCKIIFICFLNILQHFQYMKCPVSGVKMCSSKTGECGNALLLCLLYIAN